MMENTDPDDVSPQQRDEEREFLIKQKFLLEDILLELNKITINPFKLWGIIKQLRKVILIIGSLISSCLFKVHVLSQNDSNICDSMSSLQRQIVDLHERLKKLEEGNRR